MDEQGVGRGSYEDWVAVIEALLHGAPTQKNIAFLKLNRLVSGFLTTLQAWDHRDQWEDLRQIVLMKLVKSFCQQQLRDSRAFVAYARTITRNEFYDFLKARGNLVVADVPEFEQGEDASGDVDAVLAVRSALAHLPEEQHRAVQAVYLEGKTYEAAAEETGIPLGSLKRYLRLGLEQLRKQLDGILQRG
jgi:RNA polymerase sigma-70 factor (ECF subfamily)